MGVLAGTLEGGALGTSARVPAVDGFGTSVFGGAAEAGAAVGMAAARFPAPPPPE